MEHKILNTWKSDLIKQDYFYAPNPLYVNKDFKVFKSGDSYIYTYKNIAINQLVGLNKDHVDNLANNIVPGENDYPYKLIYDRAIEAMNKSLIILTSLSRQSGEYLAK